MRLLVLFLLLPLSLLSQSTWNLQLLHPTDSTPVPFAQLQWFPDGAGAYTDIQGRAKLPVPAQVGEAQLRIKAIGYDSLWRVSPRPGEVDTRWIPQRAYELEEVQLEGLTAREVVKRAMVAIPRTFADSSYAADGFYRTYDEINGQYANLMELQGMVLFFLQAEEEQLNAKEALAVQSLRRSKRWDPLPNPDEQDFMALMWHNPVYHRPWSSLTESWMRLASFSFDTITPTHYRVHYELPGHSSDNHGITSQEENPFTGEADEEGWLAAS